MNYKIIDSFISVHYFPFQRHVCLTIVEPRVIETGVLPYAHYTP